MSDDQQLLTAGQIRELLGISQPTMWRRVKDGTIPDPVLIGGLKRWRRSDIKQLIEPAEPPAVRKRTRAA